MKSSRILSLARELSVRRNEIFIDQAEVHVVEEQKRAKRTVTAPTTAGQMSGGRVLSVEVGPDEEVEWIWSHDRERGSHVTGYKIVARVAERLLRA